MSDSVSTRASDDGRLAVSPPAAVSSGVPVDTGLHIPDAAVKAAKLEFWASQHLGEHEARGFESAIQAALEVMGAVEVVRGAFFDVPGMGFDQYRDTHRRIQTAWTSIEEGEND